MREHYRSKPIHPNDIESGCINLIITVVAFALLLTILTFIILALMK